MNKEIKVRHQRIVDRGRSGKITKSSELSDSYRIIDLDYWKTSGSRIHWRHVIYFDYCEKNGRFKEESRFYRGKKLTDEETDEDDEQEGIGQGFPQTMGKVLEP